MERHSWHIGFLNSRRLAVTGMAFAVAQGIILGVNSAYGEEILAETVLVGALYSGILAFSAFMIYPIFVQYGRVLALKKVVDRIEELENRDWGSPAAVVAARFELNHLYADARRISEGLENRKLARLINRNLEASKRAFAVLAAEVRNTRENAKIFRQTLADLGRDMRSCRDAGR